MGQELNPNSMLLVCDKFTPRALVESVEVKPKSHASAADFVRFRVGLLPIEQSQKGISGVAREKLLEVPTEKAIGVRRVFLTDLFGLARVT